MFNKSLFLKCAMLAVSFFSIAAFAPTQSEAATLTITSFKRSQSGSAVVGEFTGRWTRRKKERITSIKIVALQGGRVVSQASAKLRRKRKRFSGGVGDFRADSFRVDMYYRDKTTGQLKVISSRVYR